MEANNDDAITIGQGTVISTNGGQGSGQAQITQPGSPKCWPVSNTSININGVATGGSQPGDSDVGLTWNIVNTVCGQIFLWGTGPVQ